jgi:hypothetical protein
MDTVLLDGVGHYVQQVTSVRSRALRRLLSFGGLLRFFRCLQASPYFGGFTRTRKARSLRNVSR